MSIIKFKPVFKETIWGGDRLNTDFGYEEAGSSTGECWGISAHPSGDVVVSGGEYDGLRLSELWKYHHEIFGLVNGAQFPLIIKIIDAKEDLSIQVHPDDEYAYTHENSMGKTECWYILDCDEDSQIVIGHNAKDKEELVSMIEKGQWDKLIRYENIKPGDFFFIEAGTVHAIKGGTLILETQQNSDITYRLYDYERTISGVKRNLHIRQSIDVIKVPYDEKAARPNPLKSVNTWFDQLATCEYFTIWKAELNGERNLVMDQSFLIGTCIEGKSTFGDTEVYKGDHFIIPNGKGNIPVVGNAEFIFSTP